MEGLNKNAGASSCVICGMAEGGVCLGCRTERLIEAIRTKEVDHISADSNRLEWEERCLKAEAQLAQEKSNGDRLAEALRTEICNCADMEADKDCAVHETLKLHNELRGGK